MTVVLQEILGWSRDRPAWQRDALRRLATQGELTADDIAELTEICKSAHGLTELRDSAPLEDGHLPSANASQGAVALESIFHHRGVNALAESQSLKFGPKLTLVYGDNGAGETGYIRILKSACRARGQERILGNVVSGASPLKPAVAIKYKVELAAKAREWALSSSKAGSTRSTSAGSSPSTRGSARRVNAHPITSLQDA